MEEWHKENISLYLIQIGDIDHITTVLAALN